MIYKNKNKSKNKDKGKEDEDEVGPYDDPALFEALDRAEAHLASTASEGPYWFGDKITETDIRL